MSKKAILVSLATLLTATIVTAQAVSDSPIPRGNGTWLYDINRTLGKPEAGFFQKQLAAYNQQAKSAKQQISQVFYYGGNIEVYCKSEGDCKPKSFLLNYYEPQIFNNSKNNWDHWYDKLGHSGFHSGQAYRRVPGVTHSIAIVDGRVDESPDNDYLNNLNILSERDATHLANKVAKSICADDNIDGVQFDVEPFSFTGGLNGAKKGPGQKYFYQAIAKNFAGYFDRKRPSQHDPKGINRYDANAEQQDPLQCVNAKHPNGRFFSVFTFSKDVTPEVVQVMNHHGNGFIVDSLYDLEGRGGELTTPKRFRELVVAEIAKMQAKGVPYQFAIPAAASAHEFEQIDDKITGVTQLDYVKIAVEEMKKQNVELDQNFKGVALWGWVDQYMYWNGYKIYPGTPPQDVLDYLSQNL